MTTHKRHTTYTWLRHVYPPTAELRTRVFGKSNATHNQAYMFMLAPSKVACARACGAQRASQLFNLNETGNPHTIRCAALHPEELLLCPTSGPNTHSVFRASDFSIVCEDIRTYAPEEAD